MAENTRLPGHELLGEGQAHNDKGRWAGHFGTRGEGRAKCSCGALSPVLPSGQKRKAWHREHKAQARAEQVKGWTL